MYSIAVCRLNDSTISNIDGVGAESISAPISAHVSFFGGYGWGGYGIRPYGGDFNDSVNMV